MTEYKRPVELKYTRFIFQFTAPGTRLTVINFLFLSLFMMLFVYQPVTAQQSPLYYDYPHNHLPWFTIESEHILVHYQEGSSRTAQVASRIAEEIYTPVTALYDTEPRNKISIVLRDREDLSNGAAFFFDDKIEIWVPALDTPLRGTHNWLRNVITHEFTHIIQLQASMNRSKSIPTFYVQWLSYEDVRRPDVLYGFPNTIASYPISTVSIPAWFAEGTAQYQRAGLSYDYWDSHRDMILRTSILNGNQLDLTQMNTFSSKTSLEREMVYNQGYSFTIYLVNRFGENLLANVSEAAASGINRFDNALKEVTGIDGMQLYNEWLEDRQQLYRDAVDRLHFTNSDIIENEGFFNFFPIESPDKRYTAFLSNRGRDYARTALYLREKASKNETLTLIDHSAGLDLLSPGEVYARNHGMTSNPILDFISNQFAFSPESGRLVYSRSRKNSYGEVYDDLYIYDIQSGDRQQLTNGKRIRDPAWRPGSESIAAVQLKQGTQNLVLFHPENSDIEQLTRFRSGETIYTPAWHPDGTKIYFAAADLAERGIWVFDTLTGITEEVLIEDYIDFRDPHIDSTGKYLYFSSDPDGIFNIYRMALDSQIIEKVTSVAGGAFQPTVSSDQLLYAEYRSDGYKIASLPFDRFAGSESGEYNPVFADDHNSSDHETADILYELSNFDDRDLEAIDHDEMINQDGEVNFMIETRYASDERSWRPYTETTTGFSFFPVIRFDNYTQLRGRNSRLLRAGNIGDFGENLWRDLKLGFIFSSREVTERISLMGGLMAGFGSRPAHSLSDFLRPGRLVDLDRDLFLILEHRGLSFIEASWSPTVALEFYNMKRNVRNGLQVEEFPCTSCLPETNSTDIIYDIWEAGLYLRSKISRWSMVEVGGIYSPYRVSSDGFLSRELNRFIPGSSSEYFKGTTFSASYIAELIEPTRHYDIAPRGIRGDFTYRYQPSRLIDRYEINDGILSPVYNRTLNHSLELDVRYGFATGIRSSARLQARGFTFLNRLGDSFYHDYIGGLSGINSYPYFAIGGEQSAFVRASWVTPLIGNINLQAGHYTLDKLFTRIFVEAGNAWNSTLGIGDSIKTGMGAELRFAFNSYYMFPLKLFLSGAYGLNRFNVTFSDDFITGTKSNRVTYGREFLFYLGLTFDFETF
jgi:Tol biopolymer transport system component